MQAVYVPADDMTDPAVSGILSHLDTTVILSRSQAGKGIYPAVDALQSKSKFMDRYFLGDRHYSVAQAVREHIARYKELEDIITMLGIEELAPQGSGHRRASEKASTLSDSALSRDCRAFGYRRSQRSARSHARGLRSHHRREVRCDARRLVLHEGRAAERGSRVNTFRLRLMSPVQAGTDRRHRELHREGRERKLRYSGECLSANHRAVVRDGVAEKSRWSSEYLALPGEFSTFPPMS